MRRPVDIALASRPLAPCKHSPWPHRAAGCLRTPQSLANGRKKIAHAEAHPSGGVRRDAMVAASGLITAGRWPYLTSMTFASPFLLNKLTVVSFPCRWSLWSMCESRRLK